jgi:hypothetical protein
MKPFGYWLFNSASSAEYNIYLGGLRLPCLEATFSEEFSSRYGLSRATNETVLRSMLQSHRHVHFVSGTLQGLEVDPGKVQSIQSVRYRPYDKNGSILQAAHLLLGQRLHLGTSLTNSQLTLIHV